MSNLKVTNVSIGTVVFTHPALVSFETDPSGRPILRPGSSTVFPIGFRTNPELLQLKRDLQISMTITSDAVASTTTSGSGNTADRTSVTPNNIPLVDERNVQAFLDRLEKEVQFNRDNLGGGGGGGYEVETHTLTGTDVANKFIVLDDTPPNANVFVSISGAPGLDNPTDWIVDANKIRWDGRVPDGLLVTSDVMVVSYETL